MYEKLVADALCVNDESFRAIRSEANDLTNNPLARNFDGRETAFALKASGGKCQRLRRTRGH
jgi:hypothetical protein